MNLSAEKKALQTEVGDWLEQHWSPELRRDKPAWFKKVLEAGYAVPTWSTKWFGRELALESGKIIEQEFAKVGAPGSAQDRKHLGAITVYHSGSESLKEELLYKMLTGGATCLLYSEPGAGSDLAGIRTKAELAGGEYIINGQKIWTSAATVASYGMLLARTDWDAPKHKGITFFILPMKQKGIDIRPIHQINGDATFNEVFMTDAKLPVEYVVGELNAGWKVLQEALAHERLVMSQGLTEKKAKKSSDSAQELIAMARRNGRLDDKVLRQELAQTIAYRKVHRLNMARAKRNDDKQSKASLLAIAKLAMSRVQHSEGALRAKILGASGLLDGPDHVDAKESHYYSASGYVNSIGGGTDQIQRNIIAERILGLPREIEVDRNIPFKDVEIGGDRN